MSAFASAAIPAWIIPTASTLTGAAIAGYVADHAQAYCRGVEPYSHRALRTCCVRKTERKADDKYPIIEMPETDTTSAQLLDTLDAR